MGYSTAYTFFTGASELLAALLLFVRRTATLGALVCAAVTANIAMMKLCYDVPVKIGSLHLLFAAMLLLIPDLRRLANVFLLGRPTGAIAGDDIWTFNLTSDGGVKLNVQMSSNLQPAALPLHK